MKYLIVLCSMAVFVSDADAQPTPQKITKVVKPQRLVSKTVVRSVSSPRWNLNGSWSRVKNRTDLANHLIVTHKLERSRLGSLTINQLWHLHDSEHDSEIKAAVSNVYCPPGQT